MDQISKKRITNSYIKNIVLAEDDDDDQIIFQTALLDVNPGIKLDIVADGRQLLKFLESFYPDLLFLDLDMPYKNGLECLVQIRNNTVMGQLPVIMFSSTNRAANIQTAYEMGAHLFFIKPVIYQDCVTSIRSILSLDWQQADAIREQYCVNGRYTAFN